MPAYRQLFLDHLGQTSPAPMLVEIDRAEGVFLYGPGGKRYIDLISGVSVSNTGHSNPAVVNAIREQAAAYTHLMVYGELIQGPQVLYAELLASLLPPSLSRFFFVNSGSEAVEGALKLAKRYTGRKKIVTFRNAYHGSTHGALSVQGSETYKRAYRPLLPEVYTGDFNVIESLSLIDTDTACVIAEPVQAEAGVIAGTKEFLENLRRRCTETGTLLVFDEIQTGLGRTGTLFSFMKYGVIPDILLLAKALGGGMPLGAFIASDDIMKVLAYSPPLGHITTFGGNPVCCAAGMASLKVILSEKLTDNCRQRSDQIRQSLKHKAIKEIRGEGLLLAVELEDPELVQRVITKAPEHSLLLDYFLFCNSAFRIAPPLTISGEEITLACSLLHSLLDSCV